MTLLRGFPERHILTGLITILMSLKEVTSQSLARVLKDGLLKAKRKDEDRQKNPNYAALRIIIKQDTCDVEYDVFDGVPAEQRQFYMEDTFRPSSSRSKASLAQLELECGSHSQTTGGRRTCVLVATTTFRSTQSQAPTLIDFSRGQQRTS